MSKYCFGFVLKHHIDRVAMNDTRIAFASRSMNQVDHVSIFYSVNLTRGPRGCIGSWGRSLLARIEVEKGGLLMDLYRWGFENPF